MAARSRLRSLAVAWARPVETTGMKALQLHHMIRATTAMQNPERVMARYRGVKSSARRGGGAEEAADFQRSGSRTKRRTRKAAAAGISPARKT